MTAKAETMMLSNATLQCRAIQVIRCMQDDNQHAAGKGLSSRIKLLQLSSGESKSRTTGQALEDDRWWAGHK